MNIFFIKRCCADEGAIQVFMCLSQFSDLVSFFNFSQFIFDCFLFLRGQNSICKNAFKKVNQFLMSNSIRSATIITSLNNMKRKGNDVPHFYYFQRHSELKIKGNLLQWLEFKLIFRKLTSHNDFSIQFIYSESYSH